jgi:FkbM family methyltransferase
MYARDTYLRNGVLRISDGDVVVDLGANMGNFTNLALANGPTVKVVAVEPSFGLNESFANSVGLNAGYLERTTLIRAFLGEPNEKITNLIGDDPNYANVPWIDEKELILRAGLTRIDFLKCDIEGGEFALLSKNSELLSMAKSVAVEVHAFAGDVFAFLRNLRDRGFTLLDEQWAPDGSCTVLGKRN